MAEHWAWEQLKADGEFVRVRHPHSTREQALAELDADPETRGAWVYEPTNWLLRKYQEPETADAGAELQGPAQHW